jgi:hypothetical protein
MTGATSSYPYREPQFTHYFWLVIVLLFFSLFNIYEMFVYVFFLVNILLSFSLINWLLILSCLNMVRVMVFNTTFNNVPVTSWQSVLLVEETGVPGAHHLPVASHWQTLSHNVVSSTPCHELDSNSQR